MPVYNGERSVEAAIRSIVAQTFEDWELIILDYGSQDRSLEVCSRLATEDGRIKVVAGGQNQGLGAAMNRLVALAQGALLAVQEQDDTSTPERLQAQVSAFDADPGAGVVSGVAQWMSEGMPVATFPGILAAGRTYPADMVSYLVVEQCKVVNACVMFRRECLPQGRPAFDAGARMSVDWQFFIDVAHHHRFVGLHQILVNIDRTPTRRSLTADKRLQAREARRCLHIVRRRYLRDPRSPVTLTLLRRAWATEINLEGRWRGGPIGLLMVVGACSLDPRRPELRESLADFGRRATSRLRSLTASSHPGAKEHQP